MALGSNLRRWAAGGFLGNEELKGGTVLLPKCERLRKGSEIKFVLRKKEFQGTSPLLYFAAVQNQQLKSRVAVVASRKLGKAVIRNRIRRRLVSVYRGIWHKINKKVDIVFIPKARLNDVSFDQVRVYLEQSFMRAGLIEVS